MVIKDKFILLKDKPNIINVSDSTLKAKAVDNGVTRSLIMFKLEKQLTHFSKDRIVKLLSDEKDRVAVVMMDKYPLPVTYNQKTKQIIINLNFFETEDISASTIDPRNLLSAFVYGFIFANIVEGKYKINKSIAPSIISFLLTMLIRLFGKEYGLLGSYSSKITDLKFLLSCYIYASFFGIKKPNLYRSAYSQAALDYKPIKDKLDKYNFENIDDFIKALSELKVMPGLNKNVFASKFYRFFGGYSFLAALEDLPRFIAFIGTATVSGSTIAPSFIAIKYNQEEFNNLAKIAKMIFKRT